jgi:SAM-dependent methyltransferase
MDKKTIVRNGYNSIVEAYCSIRKDYSEDVDLLNLLIDRLPKGSLILDAGCGSGIPITKILSQTFQVIGIDFAEKQVSLAQKQVSNANFICQDMTNLGFRELAFNAICSYYAIIHIPRIYHAGIFKRFYSLLQPSGFALLCLGASDLEEDVVENYLGSRMYWSHFNADTNLRLLKETGFNINFSKIVADASHPTSSHLFVLAQKI